MDDKKLLELAAKSAGLVPHISQSAMPGLLLNDHTFWSPLTDDGDALRLAVKLELGISVFTQYVEVSDGRRFDISELAGLDLYAATRRAIVRAAAEIGAKS